jgi:hypothetical protein
MQLIDNFDPYFYDFFMSLLQFSKTRLIRRIGNFNFDASTQRATPYCRDLPVGQHFAPAHFQGGPSDQNSKEIPVKRTASFS